MRPEKMIGRYRFVWVVLLSLLLPFLASAEWLVTPYGETDLYSLYSDKEGRLFAVGAEGTILRSLNKGETWEKQTSPVITSLYTMTGDEQALYTAGANGVLLRSKDHGDTWENLSLKKEARTIRRLWLSRGALYAVGDAGMILCSKDRGQSFSKEKSGTARILHSLWGNAEGQLYAVGEAGLILRSTSPGVWEARPSHTTSILRGVFGIDEALYIVGYDGVVLRSSDKGDSFEPIEAQMKDWLVGINGDQPSNLYAVGAGGAILRSASPSGPFVSVGEEVTSQPLFAALIVNETEVFFAGRGVLIRLDPAARLSLKASGPSDEGAIVYVNDKVAGALPINLTLPSGKHTLKIEKPNFQTQTQEINLAKAEKREASITLTPLVFLEIEGTQNANVFIDGVFQGITPLRVENLKPGDYQVRVALDGFSSWEGNVQLQNFANSLEVILPLFLPELPPLAIEERDFPWRWVARGAAPPLVVFAGLGVNEALQVRGLTNISSEVFDGVQEEIQAHQRKMKIYGICADVSLGFFIMGGVLHYQQRRSKIKEPTSAPVESPATADSKK